MEKRIDCGAMILPLLGIGLMLIIWTAISLKVAPDLPSPLAHLAGESAIYSKPVFQRRRDEPGDSALRVS